MGLIEILAWVAQAAGLFGILGLFLANFLCDRIERLRGIVIPLNIRRNVAAGTPFGVVTLIYVVAVLTGHDVWSWANYFDFFQVGFAAATGAFFAANFFAGTKAMTLQQLLDFLASADPQTIIATLQAILEELGQAPPPRAPQAPSPGAPEKGQA
jgi:hypothetical protein